MQAGISIEFTCRVEQGAALHLRSAATKQWILDNRRIHDYIMSNYPSWLNIVKEDLQLEIEPEQLIFIRGWYKTTPDWMATAFNKSKSGFRASAEGGIGGAGTVGAECSRESSIYTPKVVQHGKAWHPWHRIGEYRRDNAVFIMRYAVKRRWWWKGVMKLEAVAGPHQLPDQRNDRSGAGGGGIMASDSDDPMDDNSMSDEVSVHPLRHLTPTPLTGSQ